MERLLNNVKEWTGISKRDGERKRQAAREPGLTRADYSLVSCAELTPGALELWLELPEEVRDDPSLAPFRRLYEEGNADSVPLRIRKTSVPKRLPAVNSAPHLNNNLQVRPETGRNGATKTTGVAFEMAGASDNIIPEQDEHKKKKSKMLQAGHYVKMTLLLGCWLFFTVIFMMYNEKEEIVRHTSVAAGETKNFIINNTGEEMSLLVMLEGPFLSEQMEQILNASNATSPHTMDVWLERWTLRDNDTQRVRERDVLYRQTTQLWQVLLLDEEDIDLSEGERRSRVLRYKHHVAAPAPALAQRHVYAVRMRSSVNQTTPFTITYKENPLDVGTGVIYSCVLLCGLYILIIFEIINRTMAAVVVSTSALAVLALVGERPSLPELVSWLDVETLLLLFSMMVLVAIMAETGMFDFLAVFTFEVTKGKMWPLINVLCIITAVLSTVLDNVTTVLLMTPVTIRLCEVMELDPVPILMAMVLYSNIGGTATPVGDPPNVIIASNKDVVKSGINFTNFTLHMSVGCIFVCVQTYLQMRLMFRDTNKLRPTAPKDIQEMRHQISIWRRAEASLPHFSHDQQIVRQALEKKIRKLSSQLDLKVKESTKRACPKDTFHTTLRDLKQKYHIRDKILLLKASITITFVVAVFFLHSIPELNRVSLGWTALLGAILLLILADREDLEPILHRVEWSTLLFFAALFVLMEALSKLGLIEFIGGLTEALILRVDESARLAVALVLMLWVSGLCSAFVDNIPLTTMMVRVVTSLGTNPALNLPMEPLIWALAFGACLGGNGTLIGASANVVCAGVAEQHGYKFTFMQFFKIGFPIMIGHLIVATIYLLICHCAFTWH